MRTKTLLTISAIAMLGACNSGPSPEQKAMVDKEATNKAAYIKLMNAWDTGNKAAMSEVLADNFVTHNPDPDIKSTGKQQWLDALDMYRGMSPDMKADPKQLIVDGDWVAGVAMIKGTNTGPMGEMPPTNKGFECTGIDMIRFENGKAVEHWGLFDSMTMMGQLGLMGGDDHADDMVMDKEHVCTAACKGDKHIYAHGEKGHECSPDCQRMRESKS